MNIPDAYSHPLFNADIDRATHFHTRNILCTAIKDMSGRNIAVVQVGACLPALLLTLVNVNNGVSTEAGSCAGLAVCMIPQAVLS